MLAHSVTVTNSNLKTDKCMTTIPTYHVMNQSSDTKIHTI